MNDIRKLFLEKKSVSFSEIEDYLNIRSNKVAYYVKKLVDENIIIKKNNKYSLSEAATHTLPSISRYMPTPLPIVLVFIKKQNKVCLVQRKTYPYKNYWGLPGGRLHLEESLESCVERIGREELNSSLKLKKVHGILRESVVENNKIVHSFILFLVSAEGSVPSQCWINPEDVLMIPTDLKLIKEYANKSVAYQEEIMHDEGEELILVK